MKLTIVCCCALGLHQWTRWAQYKRTYLVVLGRAAPKASQGREYAKSEERQKRSCLRCGKAQDVLVSID